MKLLFVDESGDHSLQKIDPDYPVFVLGGVIVDRQYYRTVLEPRIREFKEELLGDESVILHTSDIVRAKNGFGALTDSGLRAEFYSRLNTLMRELDYKVVACAIKKHEHLAQYGENAVDPYDYALEVLTDFVRQSDVDSRIVDLVLKDKRLNIAGLQLADLVVSPIGRHIIGKPPREDWEIVKSKFRRGWKGYRGYGLVVLPR